MESLQMKTNVQLFHDGWRVFQAPSEFTCDRPGAQEMKDAK